VHAAHRNNFVDVVASETTLLKLVVQLNLHFLEGGIRRDFLLELFNK
jgi:hypothetical protein